MRWAAMPAARPFSIMTSTGAARKTNLTPSSSHSWSSCAAAVISSLVRRYIMVTSAAPSRIAVRAASAAVNPPPTTTTRLPDNALTPIDLAQEFDGGHHTRRILGTNARPSSAHGADRKEHRVETVLAQAFELVIVPHERPVSTDAKRQDIGNLFVEDAIGQAIGWNAKVQGAARLFLGFEQRNRMAFERQIVGRR